MDVADHSPDSLVFSEITVVVENRKRQLPSKSLAIKMPYFLSSWFGYGWVAGFVRDTALSKTPRPWYPLF